MLWGALGSRAQTTERTAEESQESRRGIPEVREIERWVSAAGVKRLPSFATADEFLQVLAKQRSRPIQLMADTSLPANLCGAWIATKDADVIVIDAALTGSQRDLVILHEAAHVMCGHHGKGVLSSRTDATSAAAVPSSGEDPVLWRSHFDDDQEWQAEWLATYLLTRTRRLGRKSWMGEAGGRYAARMLHGHE